MALFYLFAGISHFKNPTFFIKITPKWVYKPKTVNILIGVIELILATGLVFNFTRSLAAIGIIVLLILVFPANIYHFQLSLQNKRNISLTFLRLPIQLLLIYWAYTFI
mgnify:CR=1 FL=1|jgi:uncharacterized membrane protein|tara:strand:- start:3740 stop:4063 length:324 start_codon:yes stop_codon:yes gene_type:complete